jgi:hypothetical protein
LPTLVQFYMFVLSLSLSLSHTHTHTHSVILLIWPFSYVWFTPRARAMSIFKK